MTNTIALPPVSMADLDAVEALVQAVRWPHRRADVAAMIELGRGRLARSGDGRTLGVGLWWPFGDTVARIGLVVVSPATQGLGIGRRLVERLLADTAPRSVMLLATQAGRPLYQKLGFVDVGAVCQHQGECRGGGNADPRIRLAGPDDWAAILNLDTAAFGAARQGVMDHLLAVGRTFVLVNDGQVAGYAIERAFGRGSVVGPVVAASEPDAIALFDAAARPGFVRVDRPSDAVQLGRHLTACGLTLDSESPAMLRGHWPPAAGPQRILALAGHALG
jgi:predicted N-acetyltransferase YhbS